MSNRPSQFQLWKARAGGVGVLRFGVDRLTMDDENNVDAPADSIVLEEEIDPDYVPTQKEVEEYATCESATRSRLPNNAF